jgi:hypothetical protein
LVFVVDELSAVLLIDMAGGAKGMNEEQPASLQTALLHGRDGPDVRTQMRTAQRGSIPIPWFSTIRVT